MKLRNCYICQTRKPESEFYSDASKSTGLMNRCRSCHNKQRLERHKQRTKDYQHLIVDLKKNGCYLCGEKDIIVLDMHHLKPKSFTISKVVSGRPPPLSIFLKELEKCVVLCSNCHRRVTRGAIKL